MDYFLTDHQKTGVVVGVVVAVVILCICIIAVICCVCQKKGEVTSFLILDIVS